MCDATSFTTSFAEEITGCISLQYELILFIISLQYELILFISSKAALILQAFTNPIPSTCVSSWIEAENKSIKFPSNAFNKFFAISAAVPFLHPEDINTSRSS